MASVSAALPPTPSEPQATAADAPPDTPDPEVSKKAIAELARSGGLPVKVVLKPSHHALESDAFEAECQKLVIEALAAHGVDATAKGDGPQARSSKRKPPLVLQLEVTGDVVHQGSVPSGERYAVTLNAEAILKHKKLDLRRFTVRSRYIRGSVEKAGAFAMKHAAKELGPHLVPALNAWAQK
ncbi:MAG: hypothetical protein AAFQ82_24585 [Myxococcota bacterium]